jgi:hypothetical protein
MTAGAAASSLSFGANLVTNIWLSWRNWCDANTASIEADSEIGDLVASNLAQRQGYKAWRTAGLSTGATDAGFDVDFGQVREVEALALVFPRTSDPTLYDEPAAFAATDTVRHRLSAVSAGAGELYDSGVIESGVLDGYGYHVVRLNAPVSARYWRVDLDAISRADIGYLDVSRAWAGPAFQPAIGFSFGDNYGWGADVSVSRASRGVAEFVDNVEALRVWSMTLEGLSQVEAKELIEFERLMTSAGQFLVVRSDIEAGMGEMLARQQTSLGVASLAHARNTKAFRLVESL